MYVCTTVCAHFMSDLNLCVYYSDPWIPCVVYLVKVCLPLFYTVQRKVRNTHAHTWTGGTVTCKMIYNITINSTPTITVWNINPSTSLASLLLLCCVIILLSLTGVNVLANLLLHPDCSNPSLGLAQLWHPQKFLSSVLWHNPSEAPSPPCNKNMESIKINHAVPLVTRKIQQK